MALYHAFLMLCHNQMCIGVLFINNAISYFANSSISIFSWKAISMTFMSYFLFVNYEESIMLRSWGNMCFCKIFSTIIFKNGGAQTKASALLSILNKWHCKLFWIIVAWSTHSNELLFIPTLSKRAKFLPQCQNLVIEMVFNNLGMC